MDYSTILQMQYLINTIFMILGIGYFLVTFALELKKTKMPFDKKKFYSTLILVFSAVGYTFLLLNHTELSRLAVFLVILSLLTLYTSIEAKCELKYSILAWIIFLFGLIGAFATISFTIYGFYYHILVDFVVGASLIYLASALWISKEMRITIVLLIDIFTSFNELLLVHLPWESMLFLNFLSILVVGLFLALFLSYHTTTSTTAAVSLFSIILIFGINLCVSSIFLGRFDIFYYFLAIIYVGFALTSGTVYFLNDYLRNKYTPSLYFAITFGIAYAALFIDLFATLIYDLVRENVPPFVYFVVSKVEIFIWLLGFLIFLKAGQTLLELKKTDKLLCIISSSLLTYVVLDYHEGIFIHELVIFIVFILLTLLTLGIFIFIFVKAYKLGAHEEALRFLLFSVAFILIAFGVLLSSLVSFETATVTLFISGVVYLLLSPPKLFKKLQ